VKIIEPSFELIKPYCPASGVAALQFIERMARISHRSENSQTEDSWKPFLTAVVLQHGDWSVVEHSSATVIFRVDRGITHEIVRHRLFSFTQESTRFVKYGGKQVQELEFIKPEEIPGPELISSTKWFRWEQSIRFAENNYLDLVAEGTRPQEARSVLPNALAATIAVTGNYRSWRYLLLARTSKETHPDFKAVTIPLLKTFQERVPLLFDDIEPDARQIDNLKKPR
jgi:thymidylate synthase (FAD)